MHAEHPEHAVLQQTPSAQWAVEHCASLLHGEPAGPFAQERGVPIQLYPFAVSQLELVVQETAHFPDTHRYPVPQG